MEEDVALVMVRTFIPKTVQSSLIHTKHKISLVMQAERLVNPKVHFSDVHTRTKLKHVQYSQVNDPFPASVAGAGVNIAFHPIPVLTLFPDPRPDAYDGPPARLSKVEVRRRKASTWHLQRDPAFIYWTCKATGD
jgi:hypothetical protein